MVGLVHGEIADRHVEFHVIVEGDEFFRQPRQFGVVDQRLAPLLLLDLGRALKQRFEVAVFADELRRGFHADARHARHVVGRVADQRLHLDDLFRRHAEFLDHLGAADLLVLHGVEHDDAVADELHQILVRGDDGGGGAGLAGLPDIGRNQIVGLEAGLFQAGQIEGVDRLADQPELRPQIVGRLRAVRLVVGIHFGAEGLLGEVEHHRKVRRLVLRLHVAQKLPQHVAEAEHGVELQAVGLAVDRRQRVIGAEDVAGAVDQKDVVAFFQRLGGDFLAGDILPETCGFCWVFCAAGMMTGNIGFSAALARVSMSTVDYPPLPIDAALPELTAALRARNAAVLVAPPGAGKTTRVPLVLAGEAWAKDRRILVLEPRRLAARAAAERMAQTLRERVGDTVGLRVRFGSKISRKTRIEIVTEGIFTRLILDDPMLDGVAAVLFDEFHERSLDADLGLALARDVQQGLREDLKLLVMSATIDGARIAALLGDAPVIESEGRAFAVETRYAGRDARAIEPQITDVIVRAMRADKGSLLAFLPGAAEIRRTQTLLEDRIDPLTDVVALYGALAGEEQDRAILPAPPGRRKIVLATSIAETSITIEGVRIVIDCGLARVPRYEPDVGVTRLETVRVSRAAADQRRGRAGRTEPGICYRLWDEPQTAALEPFARPEILAADLSSFALDLAAWGSGPRTARVPRSAAARGADRGQGSARRTWRHRRRWPHHRRGPAPAAAAAAAAARAHGGRCRR